MKTAKEFIVVIDTREKKPYHFKKVEVKTLQTGDYSIVGLEDQIAIERKSKQDAYLSLGTNRSRFQKELIRLSQFDYAAIVVECSLRSFIQPPSYSKMNPRAAIHSILAWSIRYRVFVYFSSNRDYGNALTNCLLEKYWHYQTQERSTSHE